MPPDRSASVVERNRPMIRAILVVALLLAGCTVGRPIPAGGERASVDCSPRGVGSDVPCP